MEFLYAVLKGLGVGLLFSMAIGPVFFTIIHTSLYRGYKAAFPVTLGVSLVDSTFVIVCYFGLAPLLRNQQFQAWLSMAGAFIMLIFGIVSLSKLRKRNTVMGGRPPSPHFFRQLFTGVLINGINPVVFLFWAGVVGTATVDFHQKSNLTPFFLVSILFTILMMDNIKALLANKLNKIINERFIRGLNVTMGIVFIIFSLKLFHYAYKSGIADFFD